MNEQTDYHHEEQVWRADVRLFVPAVFKSWHLLLTTITGCGLLNVAIWYGYAVPTWAIPFLLSGAFIIASFSAWRTEKNAKLAALHKLKLLSDAKKLEQEKVYQEVLNGYIDYPKKTDNALYRLIKCGATRFESEDQLTRLCAELKIRQGIDPFHDWQIIPAEVRLQTLHHIRDTNVDINKWETQTHFIVDYVAENRDEFLKKAREQLAKQREALS